MDAITPETLATILATVSAIFVQISVARMSHHESDATKYKAELDKLQRDLRDAEHEIDQWRAKYWELVEKRKGTQEK